MSIFSFHCSHICYQPFQSNVVGVVPSAVCPDREADKNSRQIVNYISIQLYSKEFCNISVREMLNWQLRLWYVTN